MGNKKNASRSRATTRTRRLNWRKKFVITASSVEDATDVPKTKAGEGQTARDESDNPRLILDLNSVQQVIKNVSEHSQSCNGSLHVRNKSWKHLEITCCVCELKYIVGKESDPHEM